MNKYELIFLFLGVLLHHIGWLLPRASPFFFYPKSSLQYYIYSACGLNIFTKYAVKNTINFVVSI